MIGSKGLSMLSVLGNFLFILGLTTVVQTYYLEQLTSEEFITQAYDEILEHQFKDFCETQGKEFGITDCSSMQAVKNEICSKYGEQSMQCNQVKTILSDIENRKKVLYTEESNEMLQGLSLQDINTILKQVTAISMVFVITGLVILYLTKKEIKALMQTVSYALIITGLSCLLLKFVVENMLKQPNMPGPIAGMFSGLLSYEFQVSMTMLVIGVLGVVLGYLMKRKTS